MSSSWYQGLQIWPIRSFYICKQLPSEGECPKLLSLRIVSVRVLIMNTPNFCFISISCAEEIFRCCLRAAKKRMKRSKVPSSRSARFHLWFLFFLERPNWEPSIRDIFLLRLRASQRLWDHFCVVCRRAELVLAGSRRNLRVRVRNWPKLILRSFRPFYRRTPQSKICAPWLWRKKDCDCSGNWNSILFKNHFIC